MTDKWTISFGSRQISTFELPRLAADQKTVAERKWRQGLKPAKPQQPCDVGLFSQDADQLDLIEMCMEPTND